MKTLKKLIHLIAFIGLLSIFITGCSDKIEFEEQFIKVQKRIGDENEYEDYREITNNEKVQTVKEILHNSEWENAKVEMVHPADYRFIFQFKNPKIEAKVATYQLWLSPNKDKIELAIDEGKYIQLDSAKSAELFEKLTGEKLADLK